MPNFSFLAQTEAEIAIWPLEGGQRWPPGGQGGSGGDLHNGGQLGLWYGSHIPNYKIVTQAEAEIAISPLYSTVYSTKIGYTPTAPQGGLRGVTS